MGLRPAGLAREPHLVVRARGRARWLVLPGRRSARRLVRARHFAAPSLVTDPRPRRRSARRVAPRDRRDDRAARFAADHVHACRLRRVHRADRPRTARGRRPVGMARVLLVRGRHHRPGRPADRTVPPSLVAARVQPPAVGAGVRRRPEPHRRRAGGVGRALALRHRQLVWPGLLRAPGDCTRSLPRRVRGGHRAAGRSRPARPGRAAVARRAASRLAGPGPPDPRRVAGRDRARTRDGPPADAGRAGVELECRRRDASHAAADVSDPRGRALPRLAEPGRPELLDRSPPPAVRFRRSCQCERRPQRGSAGLRPRRPAHRAGRPAGRHRAPRGRRCGRRRPSVAGRRPAADPRRAGALPVSGRRLAGLWRRGRDPRRDVRHTVPRRARSNGVRPDVGWHARPRVGRLAVDRLTRAQRRLPAGPIRKRAVRADPDRRDGGR